MKKEYSEYQIQFNKLSADINNLKAKTILHSFLIKETRIKLKNAQRADIYRKICKYEYELSIYKAKFIALEIEKKALKGKRSIIWEEKGKLLYPQTLVTSA